MNGLRRTALCGSVLVALSSLAASQGGPAPEVVPHPLVVVGGSEDDVARFGPQLDAELSRRDIRVVGQQCARQFVAARPGGSCAGDERCLAELARACGGQRALYVTVYPFRPRMVFVGKLVRSDGLLERSVSNLEVTRPKGRLRPEMIRPGIEKVLTEGLHVEMLDLQPLVTAPVAGAVETPPVTPVPEPRAEVPPAAVAPAMAHGASGQRIAAYACVGAGAVALAVGTALFFGAKGNEDAYRKTLDPYAQRPPTPEAAAAQDSLRSKSTPVTIALVAGAALVATGVTLWILDGSKPEGAQVELRPGAGGGSLVMVGRF
ncbi:MAG TPA: hypothetical protein VMT11_17450 [Myxococcaceae bacterium]|nr:hypothetical protein [Myxococcaceae bacterium]